MHEDGSISGPDSIAYSENDDVGLNLRDLRGVDTFVMDGDTYAVASSYNTRDDSVQLIRVHEDGTLEAANSATGLTLQTGARYDDVAAFALPSGSVHVAAAANTAFGVVLFDISLPAPSVRYVTSPDDDGSYPNGTAVNVTVVFNARVYVDADSPPTLNMSTGRDAAYAYGNGTTALTFRYVVEETDTNGVLSHGVGPNSLDGAIKNYLGTQANRTLPAAGSGNTLGERKSIIIDTMPPELLSVSSPYDDLYGPHTITDPGAVVPIAVHFDEPAVIDERHGRPVLRLDAGGPAYGNATYASGNGTSALVFEYTVQQGDRTDDLNYTGTDAFSLNGGTIADYAGHAFEQGLVLPAPGHPDSLSGSESIMIDTRLSPPPSTLQPTIAYQNEFVSSGTTLDSVRGLDALVLPNGETYVIAAGRGMNTATGNAVQMIHVRDGSTLTLGNHAEDGSGGFGALENVAYVDAFALRDGGAYAMAASDGDDDAVQLIRVRDDATLAAADEARDGRGAYDSLDSPSDIDVFVLRNGDTYALVASEGDDAVQLIRVHEDGTMSAADSALCVCTPADQGLRNSEAVTAFRLRDGSTHALAGGENSNYVQLLGVQADGTLALEGVAQYGTFGLDRLANVTAMASFALRNGSTYALAASHDGDAVQMIRVHEDGSLRGTASIMDDGTIPALRLEGRQRRRHLCHGRRHVLDSDLAR